MIILNVRSEGKRRKEGERGEGRFDISLIIIQVDLKRVCMGGRDAYGIVGWEGLCVWERLDARREGTGEGEAG